jgi:glycosyltransferase involved in cell wall biosynthesis
MDVPLISIIIPVYNAEKTIKRAIRSIRKQSVPNFELLLINDGSTDNSLEIMRYFEERDTRIMVYDIPNSGVSRARNVGIEHVRGKYTTFLDADDYYVENAFENVISHINDQTELVIFGYNIEYENSGSKCILPSNKDLQFSRKIAFRNYAVSLIENEMINAPWNKVYLTSYLKERQILFSDEFDIGEDLLFNLTFIRDVQHVRVINKALVHYTVKKGEGLVSRFRPNRFDLRFRIIMDISELLKYWGTLLENRVMIDRLVIRDIMAFFMDFYKKNCKFSNDEKLQIINEILSRKEINEVLGQNNVEDFSTKLLELLLKTKNSRFILFAAKIFNIKRVFR